MNPIEQISLYIKAANTFLSRSLRIEPEAFFKDRYYEIGINTNNFQCDGESKNLIALDVANKCRYEISVAFFANTKEWAVKLIKSKTV